MRCSDRTGPGDGRAGGGRIKRNTHPSQQHGPCYLYDDSSTSSTTTAPPTTTTTTAPPTTTTTAPPATTTPPPPTTAAPPVSVTPDAGAGTVTAIGDSVMLDYQDPLETDIPGAAVYAAVSRQWDEGEAILQQLKASGQLGSEVIVALSTNGPISSSTDFSNMMAILSGVKQDVFVNVHVDQPWQDPNNAVIAAGVSQYPNTVLADWASLAAQNPQWLGPTVPTSPSTGREPTPWRR